MLQLIKTMYKEKTEKVLGTALMENQGLFMVVSGVFPINSYYTIFAMLVILLVLCLLSYTAVIFYIDFNISLLSETAHFVMVLFCALSFYVVFWFRKDRVYNIMKLLNRNFYKYEETIDPETKQEIDEMTIKMKNRKKKIRKIMTVFYNICGIFGVILLPLIFRKTTTKVTGEGIYMTTPVIVYFPLSGDIGWYLCVLMESLATFFIITALNGSDVAFCCFCEEGCNQLLILCHTLRYALRRASFTLWWSPSSLVLSSGLYINQEQPMTTATTQRYVHKTKFGTEQTSLQARSFSICIKICMDDSVKHHYALIKYFEEVQALFSWCVMVVMMAGALMLCLSGIFFFTKSVEFGTKVCFIFYLLGELIHTFIYAWYGQQMSEKSAEIREVLYKLEWEESSRAVKPYIMIMQAYLNNPLKLKGGDFMEYDLNTFGNICSSAYSYINLLSAAVDSSL